MERLICIPEKEYESLKEQLAFLAWLCEKYKALAAGEIAKNAKTKEVQDE